MGAHFHFSSPFGSGPVITFEYSRNDYISFDSCMLNLIDYQLIQLYYNTTSEIEKCKTFSFDSNLCYNCSHLWFKLDFISTVNILQLAFAFGNQ